MPLIPGMRTSVTMQPAPTSGSALRKATADFVGAHRNAGRAKQEGERVAHRVVVVDDVDHRLSGHRNPRPC